MFFFIGLLAVFAQIAVMLRDGRPNSIASLNLFHSATLDYCFWAAIKHLAMTVAPRSECSQM